MNFGFTYSLLYVLPYRLPYRLPYMVYPVISGNYPIKLKLKEGGGALH